MMFWEPGFPYESGWVCEGSAPGGALVTCSGRYRTAWEPGFPFSGQRGQPQFMPYNWLKRGCGPMATPLNRYSGAQDARTRRLPRVRRTMNSRIEHVHDRPLWPPGGGVSVVWTRTERDQGAGQTPRSRIVWGRWDNATSPHRPHAPLLPHGESRAHNRTGSGRALPRVVPYGSNGSSGAQSPLFSSAMHVHEPQPGQAVLPRAGFPSPRSKSVGRPRTTGLRFPHCTAYRADPQASGSVRVQSEQ